jgi:hypothetical protein
VRVLHTGFGGMGGSLSSSFLQPENSRPAVINNPVAKNTVFINTF